MGGAGGWPTGRGRGRYGGDAGSAQSGCHGVSVSAGLIWIEPHDQHPRNADLSKSLPRHPRRNFTESRVRSRALARPRTSRNKLCRASRPKTTKAFGKLLSVTSNRLTIQAQTYARAQAVAGTRAVLHDAKVLASVFFATQARYCCGSSGRMTLCVGPCAWWNAPPPSVVKFNAGPPGETHSSSTK